MHEVIKIVASYFIVIPVVVAAYIWWRLKRPERLRFLATLIAGGIISIVLAKLASALYTDPRPFVQGHFTPLLPHSADNGFPSDHTLLASFIAWAVLRHNRKLGFVLLAVAALIGLSRMAAGIHHLSDVLASFVLSAIGLAAANAVITLIARRKADKR